jgi:putative restriction endonuclease
VDAARRFIDDSRPGMPPFIAVTDKHWFDFLAASAPGGVADEVNFWSPKSTRPMKQMDVGDVVFFRLKHPINAIAGYGFFAVFRVLDIDLAWELFGWKNGDPDKLRFLERIGAYRGVDLLSPATSRAPLGCTALRFATFWPRDRWIPWGEDRGFARNIVQGKTENDPDRILLLLQQLGSNPPDDLELAPFEPLDTDDRMIVLAEQVAREGQGTFRARLLDAYRGRCAITGEHTEPVLDAAHIQPYLGPRSNHVQNGLLLTKEFHALFDRGYVTVTPDHVVHVSPRLRDEWKNGHRYYPFDGQKLREVPGRADMRPSAAALDWHRLHRFQRVA